MTRNPRLALLLTSTLLGYVDLASPLLDENGELRDVFVDDGLHLNEWGCELWQQALAPYLE